MHVWAVDRDHPQGFRSLDMNDLHAAYMWLDFGQPRRLPRGDVRNDLDHGWVGRLNVPRDLIGSCFRRQEKGGHRRWNDGSYGRNLRVCYWAWAGGHSCHQPQGIGPCRDCRFRLFGRGNAAHLDSRPHPQLVASRERRSNVCSAVQYSSGDQACSKTVWPTGETSRASLRSDAPHPTVSCQFAAWGDRRGTKSGLRFKNKKSNDVPGVFGLPLRHTGLLYAADALLSAVVLRETQFLPRTVAITLVEWHQFRSCRFAVHAAGE